MGIRGPRRKRVWLWGIIIWYSYNQLNGPGLHWSHAGPKGAVLTRNSARFWNINGILIRTRNTQTFMHFRRIPWYLVPKR